MARYDFEYNDENGVRHVFEANYPINYDFTTVKSPCGNYVAKKLDNFSFASKFGLTRKQKEAGTTSKRVEMGEFMKEQRKKRKNAYEPGTRQHESNELWTGTEGSDGVTETPITKKVDKV